jgi:glycolate oxidase FAD binding subunit
MDQLDLSAIRRLFDAALDTDQVRSPRAHEARAARLIVEPANPGQIAEIVRRCESDGLALVPIGAARTLAQLRSQPVDVGVSLTRMDRIVEYEPDDMTVVAEAGCTLATLNECTEKHGQRLPCDPPNPQLTTLGALVGAAKSGPLRLSEGRVRDLLIGIRFVGHDGRLIHGGGKVVKNVAGYDLMKVMTGAFGTLGVIAETTFKLRPLPEYYSLSIAAFDNTAEALIAAQRAEQAANLTHLEVLSPSVCIVLGRPGRAIVVAGFGGSRTETDYYRAHLSNALRRNTQMLTGDEAIAHYRFVRDLAFPDAVVAAQLAVLPAELAGCLGECAVEFCAHPGNGVAELFLANDRNNGEVCGVVERWREIAHRARGHLRILAAQEKVRAKLQMFDLPPEPALQLMRRLKFAFDPKNIFNPGCFVGGI